jgi:hypothetical protein
MGGDDRDLPRLVGGGRGATSAETIHTSGVATSASAVALFMASSSRPVVDPPNARRRGPRAATAAGAIPLVREDEPAGRAGDAGGALRQ